MIALDPVAQMLKTNVITFATGFGEGWKPQQRLWVRLCDPHCRVVTTQEKCRYNSLHKAGTTQRIHLLNGSAGIASTTGLDRFPNRSIHISMSLPRPKQGTVDSGALDVAQVAMARTEQLDYAVYASSAWSASFCVSQSRIRPPLIASATHQPNCPLPPGSKPSTNMRGSLHRLGRDSPPYAVGRNARNRRNGHIASGGRWV